WASSNSGSRHTACESVGPGVITQGRWSCQHSRAMARRHGYAREDRLRRGSGTSVQSWQRPRGPAAAQMKADALVEMGWGRLIFGHTFASDEKLIDTLSAEPQGMRDLAIYLRDPHVVLAMAPDRLF